MTSVNTSTVAALDLLCDKEKQERNILCCRAVSYSVVVWLLLIVTVPSYLRVWNYVMSGSTNFIDQTTYYTNTHTHTHRSIKHLLTMQVWLQTEDSSGNCLLVSVGQHVQQAELKQGHGNSFRPALPKCVCCAWLGMYKKKQMWGNMLYNCGMRWKKKIFLLKAF